MKKLTTIALLFVCVVGSAQIKATTEEGLQVLLYSDGTWKSVKSEPKKEKIVSTEKLAEFETTHMSTSGFDTKIKNKIEVYGNKIVITIIPTKQQARMFKKTNQPLVSEMPYALEEIKYGEAVSYKYTDERVELLVNYKGVPKPSLVFKTKDSFTGATAVVTYFSL